MIAEDVAAIARKERQKLNEQKWQARMASENGKREWYPVDRWPRRPHSTRVRGPTEAQWSSDW